MKLCIVVCVAALPLVADAFLAPSQGSFLAHRSTQPHCSGLHGSRLPAFRVASARSHRLPATRQDRLGPRMQEGKSAGQLVIIAIVAVGFLFGALYPLINNSVKYAQAPKELSGAATGLRQKEIDARLSRVPAYAVTDDKGTPYVAEYNGGNKGFFFLDPADADKYRAKVQSLQAPGAAVKVSPTSLDLAIKYLKSKKNADPFEILPAQPQVDAALQIKNPDTCDICWGAEGVKGKIPVFWIEGLGVERDGKTITPLFFEKAMAEQFYKKLNKPEAPTIEVFDLSATVKKMRKGGSSEFRKVLFYPSSDSVNYAKKLIAEPGSAPRTASDDLPLFPESSLPPPEAPGS